MKKFFALGATLAASLTLSACMEGSGADDGTVVDSLIGKPLVSDSGTILLNANGTVGGNIRGDAVVGTYTANSKEICSTYSAPKVLSGREWCSVPMIDGDTVVFDRQDGTKSPAYKIGG